MHDKTNPPLTVAKAIQTAADALLVIMEMRSVAIPWEDCSERLAHASQLERSQAELSRSGYGIHWRLEDT